VVSTPISRLGVDRICFAFDRLRVGSWGCELGLRLIDSVPDLGCMGLIGLDLARLDAV